MSTLVEFLPTLSFISTCFVYFLFSSFRERERACIHKRGTGGDRGRGRRREPQAGATLHTEPDVGFDPTTLDHDLS